MTLKDFNAFVRGSLPINEHRNYDIKGCARYLKGICRDPINIPEAMYWDIVSKFRKTA